MSDKVRLFFGQMILTALQRRTPRRVVYASRVWGGGGRGGVTALGRQEICSKTQGIWAGTQSSRIHYDNLGEKIYQLVTIK